MPTAILKPAHEVALLLTMRRAKSEKGAQVQAAVLFRVEVGMWINEALKGA
jgi:hypothetical protein